LDRGYGSSDSVAHLLTGPTVSIQLISLASRDIFAEPRDMITWHFVVAELPTPYCDDSSLALEGSFPAHAIARQRIRTLFYADRIAIG